MTSALPGGTVTFLYTDIEGSTPLWEGEPERMRPALAQHDAILQQAVAAHQGVHYKTIGDAIQAAFALPAEAVAAALAAQRALQAAAWPTSTPLRVRMGLHTGPAEPDGADYATTHTLNRVARIMSAAHGGQIVLSVETAELLRGYLPPDSRLRDLGQHRMKGMTQREHLFQLEAPGLPAEFPPLATLAGTPNNLPAPLTSFVGRETEIAHARGLLATARLLTLTGSGGTGKTRLSLQIAAEVLAEHADGAWLVELAPLADPALVPRAMAAALGVREQPDRPVLETLADFLRAKQLLLILDNCEHVLAACAEAADHLLRQCPRLRLLASSREALGIAGETTYPVPSLSLPATAGEQDLAAIARAEAVRLFVARAQAALPSFSLTADNAAAVVQICRRLDGIPLAIELAAARVRLLRPDQIASRLDDRFRLLTGGSRTALPRQQTLRALIDWSYALLSEPERQFLQALSVFAGGWTLEAAEAVGEEDERRTTKDEGQIRPSSIVLRQPDVLDLLSNLTNKSLVVVDQGEAPRYRLLETIRQYAREKLLEAPEGQAASWRARHLGYFLRYAQQVEPELYGPRLVAALDALEREHDNFRAALTWALDSDPLAALRLAGALATFWARRGYAVEGAVWLDAALVRGLIATPPGAEAARPYQLARAHALALRALIDFGSMNNVPAVRDTAEESVALARTLGDSAVLQYSLAVLALSLAYWGDAAAAQAAAREALALPHTSTNWDAVEMAQGALVVLTSQAGRHEEAHAGALEALRLARQTGDPWAIAQITLGLGRLAAERLDLAEVRARTAEAAEQFRLLGDLSQANHARSDLARALRRLGQFGEASAVYRETLSAWASMGHRGAVAQQLENLAFIDIELGRGARAARLLGAAERLRQVSHAARMTFQQPEYEQAVAQLRAQLPAPELDAAWAAGRALELNAAVAYALEETPDLTGFGNL